MGGRARAARPEEPAGVPSAVVRAAAAVAKRALMGAMPAAEVRPVLVNGAVKLQRAVPAVLFACPG